MSIFSFRHGGSGRRTKKTSEPQQADSFSAALSEAVARRQARDSGKSIPKKEKTGGISGKAKGRLLVLASVVVLVLSLVVIVHDQLKTYVVPPTKPNAAVNDGADANGNSPSNHKPGRTDASDALTGEDVVVEVPEGTKANFYNILIVGTDGDGTRTDTIIIANLNAADHTVGLMSIPRDTLVYGKYSVPKINSIYGSYGQGERGIKALEDTLAETLGFRVDGYVIVDLQAFEKTVDLVGGVDFNVPQNMYYRDPTQDLYIDLKKGMQHLDGKHAIQLCRFRKGYATQDIRRTEVQQLFLQALAKQCLRVSNVSKINEFAEIFYSYVQTDLTVGNMAYFGLELLKCNFDEMVHVTLPGESVMIRGGSYYQLYPNATLKIVNDTFNPYDSDLQLRNLRIRNSSMISTGGSTTTNNGGNSGSNGGHSGNTGNDPQPTSPPETSEPQEPTTDPVTPEDPIEPTEAPQPTDPPAPTEASQPTDPPAPTEASQPTDPPAQEEP